MKLPEDILYKLPTDYNKIEDEANRTFIKNLLYAIAETYRDIAKTVNLNVDLLSLQEKSKDPNDPAEGNAVMWMSDGTGTTGDDGDICVAITAGGSTKKTVLVDFSAI